MIDIGIVWAFALYAGIFFFAGVGWGQWWAEWRMRLESDRDGKRKMVVSMPMNSEDAALTMRLLAELIEKAERQGTNNSSAACGQSALTDGLGDAPPNNLPTWDECALRVANSDFIAKRVAEGGHGPEADSKLATQLHRFIYEYDDADPVRSAWFLHRLELALEEARATPNPNSTTESVG